MVKTKQTACGSSLSRPAGMAAVRFEAPEQFENIKDIDESEWPNMDKPPQAAEEGEASKSAGKTGQGKGSKAVDKPTPTGAEGGAEAPPDTHRPPLSTPQTLKLALARTPLTPLTPPRTIRTKTNQVL